MYFNSALSEPTMEFVPDSTSFLVAVRNERSSMGRAIVEATLVVTFIRISELNGRWLVNKVREQSLLFAEDGNTKDDD